MDGVRAPSVSQPDVAAIDGDDRHAFWLNTYNEMVRDELAARPRSGHLFRHRRLFRTVGVEVDGLWFTPDVIEHGLLRGNRRPPFGLRRVLRRGDPRLAHAPWPPDPRIHFALNCGARSCPPIREYEGERVGEQLETATRAYLEAETEIDRTRGLVRLPHLLKLYRADFGGAGGAVAFAAAHLDEDIAGLKVRYGDYDWTMGAAGPAAS